MNIVDMASNTLPNTGSSTSFERTAGSRGFARSAEQRGDAVLIRTGIETASRLLRLVVGCLLLGSSVTAAVEVQPGQLVLARTPLTRLYEGREVVAVVPPGLALSVIERKGDWLWTGRGWVREKDVVPIEQAVEAFDVALASSPSAFTWVNRARALYELHEYAHAIADCNRAIEVEAGYGPALCWRGRAYAKIGNLDSALTDLDAAIASDATMPSAYIGRAHVRQERGQLQEALSDADRAVELDPKSAIAFSTRGRIYSKLGDDKRAISDFDSALRLNPLFHSVLNNRGNAWFRQGEFRKAIDDYTAAIQVHPSAPIYLHRAMAWARLGDAEQASADFAQTMRLDTELAARYRDVRRSKAE